MQLAVPMRKKLISTAIICFLAVQIYIPASYYWHNEPTSERYSWRMFSSVDLSTWDTKVTAFVEQNGQLVEQEVPLQVSLQETYVKAIQRAQFDIVEPFMRRLLTTQQGVREVRFLAQGTFPSGQPMAPIQLSMKADGKLVTEANQ